MARDKELSQLDPGGVLKSAHDFASDSLRVINGTTSVPSDYSRVEITYNSSASVTNAKFYKGTQAEITEVKFNKNVLSMLNETYFQIYSERNTSVYHVWYNVAGLGTDPAPSGSIGLEVEIEANEEAPVIALATLQVLRKIEDFKVTRVYDKLLIETVEKGISDNAQNFGTNFVITTIQQGAEELVKNLDIPFDNKTRYIYNTQERKFEIESISSSALGIDADGGDNIAISRHENPREVLLEDDFLPNELSTSAYTNIFTYTSIEDLRVRTVKIKADTFGVFKLIIDGETKDYFRTSPLDGNCKFIFLEEIDLLTGDDIEIEFIPDRIQVLSNYNFFMRIEAYVD